MLTVYDNPDRDIIFREDYFSNSRENNLIYSAREIMHLLSLSEADCIAAMERVSRVCLSMHIAFDHNFKRSFRYDGQSMLEDWMLSPLGSYLLIINCDPVNENVARAQLFFLNKP